MSYPFKRYTVCETRCADYATHCNALQWDSRFNRIHDLRCMLVRSQDFHKFFPEILNRCNGTQIPNALSISVSLWHMFHLHVHVCVYIYIHIYMVPPRTNNMQPSNPTPNNVQKGRQVPFKDHSKVGTIYCKYIYILYYILYIYIYIYVPYVPGLPGHAGLPGPLDHTRAAASLDRAGTPRF